MDEQCRRDVATRRKEKLLTWVYFNIRAYRGVGVTEYAVKHVACEEKE